MTLTPLKSVRHFCLWCSLTSQEVKLCPSTNCQFFDFRDGRKHGKRFSVKIIRKKCLDCSEGVPDVKECPFDGKSDDECPLWRYRMGRVGKSGRKGNPEALRRWRSDSLRKGQTISNGGGFEKNSSQVVSGYTQTQKEA